ncbi:hypothetical protein [Daejeonella sp.]|uniref:hypothetical protein n=1 Tax=Daejeonella sp. TaxID=2805397 RepID=UPI0039834F2A
MYFDANLIISTFQTNISAFSVNLYFPLAGSYTISLIDKHAIQVNIKIVVIGNTFNSVPCTDFLFNIFFTPEAQNIFPVRNMAKPVDPSFISSERFAVGKYTFPPPFF